MYPPRGFRAFKQPGFETPQPPRVSNGGVGSSIESSRSLWGPKKAMGFNENHGSNIERGPAAGAGKINGFWALLAFFLHVPSPCDDLRLFFDEGPSWLLRLMFFFFLLLLFFWCVCVCVFDRVVCEGAEEQKTKPKA